MQGHKPAAALTEKSARHRALFVPESGRGEPSAPARHRDFPRRTSTPLVPTRLCDPPFALERVRGEQVIDQGSWARQEQISTPIAPVRGAVKKLVWEPEWSRRLVASPLWSRWKVPAN